MTNAQYGREYAGKNVTVRKEGQHYVAAIGGIGYSLHATKALAVKTANSYRRQLGRK